MTTTAADLGKFEGRAVTKTTIAVRNAGDGLSQALKIDPVLLHQGDTVYVVLECKVGKVTFDPYDEGVCARVQNLDAGTATIIDEQVVRDAIDVQRVRIQRAADDAKGQGRLPVDLHSDHIGGDHAGGLVEGCPDCTAEIEAIAEEAIAEQGADVLPIGSRANRQATKKAPAKAAPRKRAPRKATKVDA